MPNPFVDASRDDRWETGLPELNMQQLRAPAALQWLKDEAKPATMPLGTFVLSSAFNISLGQRFAPSAMEFDHLPAFDKRFILAQAPHRGLATVRAELKKCEIVCANCHRVRTIARRESATPLREKATDNQPSLFAG